MTAPNMLRVRPHKAVGDLPVPLEDGTKLTHARAGKHGHLVADTMYIRRRIRSRELELLAEGAAALPAAIEAKAAQEAKAAAADAPAPVGAAATVKGVSA